MAHLRGRDIAHLGLRQSRLPKGSESCRFNGYGTDTQLLVAVLEATTEVKGLRACTLLQLKNVAAGNGIGALKSCRAWRPVCYAEAERSGSPVYDRLIWQLQAVNACTIHQVPLVSRCWSCGEIQRSHASKTSLFRCEWCSARLSRLTKSPRHQRWSCPTSKHINSFVEYLSSHPSLTFVLGNMGTFFSHVLQDHDRRTLVEDIGDVFHHRGRPIKPTLSCMFDIAAYFDVPLEEILTSPSEAYAQKGFGFIPMARQKIRRPDYNDTTRRTHAYAILEKALSGGAPYPSLPSVSAQADVSMGYLRHTFRTSVEKLIQLGKVNRSSLIRRQTRMITRLLEDDNQHLSFQTDREYIDWIASKTGASISHVRKVRKERIA